MLFFFYPKKLLHRSFRGFVTHTISEMSVWGLWRTLIRRICLPVAALPTICTTRKWRVATIQPLNVSFLHLDMCRSNAEQTFEVSHRKNCIGTHIHAHTHTNPIYIWFADMRVHRHRQPHGRSHSNNKKMRRPSEPPEECNLISRSSISQGYLNGERLCAQTYVRVYLRLSLCLIVFLSAILCRVIDLAADSAPLLRKDI